MKIEKQNIYLAIEYIRSISIFEILSMNSGLLINIIDEG
jgi:hypothetical protein